MAINKHEQICSLPGNLSDAPGGGVVLMDARSGQILYANESFRNALQYGADEILKSGNILELIHPQDRHVHILHQENLLKDGVDGCRFEARYLKKDGGFVPMHTTQTAIRNPPGRLRWITCTLDEVTEPAEPLDATGPTSNLATVAIWNWSPGGRSARAPASFDVLFGSPRVVGQPSIESLTQDIHADDTIALQLMLRRSLSGVPGTQDYRKLGTNGEIRWIRETVTPIKGSSGEVTNIVGMSIDITSNMDRILARESHGIFAFIQYLETHWDKPLILPRVAKEHSLSVRSLKKYFDSLGITPLEFLKRIKLAHAYDMLSKPEARTTVTNVSRKCGFGNLGHFAKDYRNEFSELPSETLLRSRTQSVHANEARLCDKLD